MSGALRVSQSTHSRSGAGAAVGGTALRFARDERGVTAVLFSIMFAFLFLIAAIAVDYGRAVTEEMEQQAALDAAVLAASHELGKDEQDTQGQQRAEKVFAANMRPNTTAVVDVNLDAAAGEVTGTVSNPFATTFLSSRVAKESRRDTLQLGSYSRAVKGNGKLEIALVVDNSGSMSSDIDDLQTAAGDLVTEVFAGASDDKVKVAVVPFSTSVNVGSVNADADWMDTEAASSIHSENFSQSKSRFTLFTELGEDWGGCVEERPVPYDLTDDVPVAATPDTKFVPMFAPDEPDDANAGAAGYDNYPNNYISDYGGTCPAAEQVCLVYNKKKGKCTSYGPATMPVADAQSRVCKYSGATISDGTGPNYGCETTAILPLTSTKTDVTAAISALSAVAYTNIPEGVMWGWRVLSPTAPFSEGRAYSDTDNKKIMVVMTDGANTYADQDNHNESRYMAFGYASKGRVGADYSRSGYNAAMNTKLTTACANAKATGITVYTVAFRLEDDTATQALLKSCATDNDHYFAASSGNALVQAFQEIGKSIARLYVAG